MAETTSARQGSETQNSLPARPAQLTLSFLQQVIDLREESPSSQRIASFSWKALEVGVISEVVGLDVQLHGEECTGDHTVTHKRLIAKFLRPEFPFERMFEVESSFYKGFGSRGAKELPFPFALPRALFLSSQLIIMERIEGIGSYSCVHGCPEDQIVPVVKTLAQMHGRFWHADCSQLAPSAGIGSELCGEAKQEKFPESWRSFLDDVPLKASDRERIAHVCEQLSETPEQLARIHQAVADGPSTLIHGDFHTGNLLFPASNENSLALVDWATCGKGNAMRDLAFFFIVGVRSTHREKMEAPSLLTYFETIRQEGVSQLTLDEWKRHYRMCVLNQFVILVVYDSLSKHLASNAKTEKLRQELHEHFREVNVRASLALLDHYVAAEVAQL